MYYLLYVSYATEPFSEEELRALLVQSRKKNKEHGITGMLVYIDGKFIQVLEGPKEKVEQLYAMICRDPRHQKVSTLLEGIIPKRNFAEWSMGFKVLNQREFTNLSGFTRIKDFFNGQFPKDAPHPALIFLKLFYDKNIQDY